MENSIGLKNISILFQDLLGSFDAGGRNVEVAFCFDTTGSMYSCLKTVRYFSPGPEVIILFPCSTLFSMKLQLLIKYKC